VCVWVCVCVCVCVGVCVWVCVCVCVCVCMSTTCLISGFVRLKLTVSPWNTAEATIIPTQCSNFIWSASAAVEVRALQYLENTTDGCRLETRLHHHYIIASLDISIRLHHHYIIRYLYTITSPLHITEQFCIITAYYYITIK